MKVFAALAVFWVIVSAVVVIFLLGDDNPCGTTPSTSGTTGGGHGGASGRSWPLKEGTYEISDVFGSRGGAHQGTDFAAPAGTPIYAAMDGTVAQAGEASGFGIWIVLDHNISGVTTSTVYGHMYASDLLVHAGDSVSAGQQIAAVGSNGESSGPHLHFEVWPSGGRLGGGSPIDPVPWLEGSDQPTGSSANTAEMAGAATGTAPTTTAAAAPGKSSGCGTSGGGVDDLQSGTEIPPELEPWYRKGGTVCPQITSSMLAAQGLQESGFQRGLTSSSGAQGLAQFLPGTAAAIAPDGQPYVIDADGNGTASVWDDGDAIIGQARYMCQIADTIDTWMAEGRVHYDGDRRELYFAGYNAGEGAVLASGGFPSGHSDYVTQTRPYADIIVANIPRFSKTLS
ncbi:M23 family metallopeptidase [Nocardia yamanashiensis]|uniref:M23 family metallopeptidase n=1 Tax=Nocardia yamanashiensis TaxID=209247 RepID=UPI0009FF8267|nr:M23 family metallopeptidase [Nocardia yamanashiensis]